MTASRPDEAPYCHCGRSEAISPRPTLTCRDCFLAPLLAMTEPPKRPIPTRVADRLIVALDLPDVEAARAMAARLDGIVSFFKLGLWLIFAPGFERLVEDLVGRGKKVFLDAKMFDIGETVKQGVARAVERGVSFVTVHGD